MKKFLLIMLARAIQLMGYLLLALVITTITIGVVIFIWSFVTDPNLHTNIVILSCLISVFIITIAGCVAWDWSNTYLNKVKNDRRTFK
jgi:hypothetical protein